MAANVAAETTPPAAPARAVALGDEPMAATVFTDYFILLARQLVHRGLEIERRVADVGKLPQ